MPRLRQNDREQAVGMVQAGMTHHAVADHFNASRITISRLVIRLRQTGRTNGRPRNDMPRVMLQRQDRHLRLIHLNIRMITTERHCSSSKSQNFGSDFSQKTVRAWTLS